VWDTHDIQQPSKPCHPPGPGPAGTSCWASGAASMPPPAAASLAPPSGAARAPPLLLAALSLQAVQHCCWRRCPAQAAPWPSPPPAEGDAGQQHACEHHARVDTKLDELRWLLCDHYLPTCTRPRGHTPALGVQGRPSPSPGQYRQWLPDHLSSSSAGRSDQPQSLPRLTVFAGSVFSSTLLLHRGLVTTLTAPSAVCASR
jgi:hypothetical protein